MLQIVCVHAARRDDLLCPEKTQRWLSSKDRRTAKILNLRCVRVQETTLPIARRIRVDELPLGIGFRHHSQAALEAAVEDDLTPRALDLKERLPGGKRRQRPPVEAASSMTLHRGALRLRLIEPADREASRGE